MLLFRKGNLFLIKDNLSRLNFVDLWLFSCFSKTEGPLVKIRIGFGRGRMLGYAFVPFLSTQERVTFLTH